MKWEFYEDVLMQTDAESNGDYGGTTLDSQVSFIARKRYNKATVSCTPEWKGSEQVSLKRTFTLNVICKYQ